jgi:hypothetical protein
MLCAALISAVALGDTNSTRDAPICSVQPCPRIEKPCRCMQLGVSMPCPTASGTESRGAHQPQLLDRGLASGLRRFFRDQTVLQFGAGSGCYVTELRRLGLASVRGYDGSPSLDGLSGGLVGHADLAQVQSLEPADWVLSLAAVEPVPREREAPLLSNLHRHNRLGIVLTWTPAAPDSGMPSYVERHIRTMGYTLDSKATQRLAKTASSFKWLRRTLSVFRRRLPRAVPELLSMAMPASADVAPGWESGTCSRAARRAVPLAGEGSCSAAATGVQLGQWELAHPAPFLDAAQTPAWLQERLAASTMAQCADLCAACAACRAVAIENRQCVWSSSVRCGTSAEERGGGKGTRPAGLSLLVRDGRGRLTAEHARAVASFRSPPTAESVRILDVFSYGGRHYDRVLEIRLHELNRTVDKFVILETPRALSGLRAGHGRGRGVQLDLTRPQFAPFASKIVHYVYGGPLQGVELDSPTPKVNQARMRDQGFAAAYGAAGPAGDGRRVHDLLVLADIDEVPRAEVLAKLAAQPDVLQRLAAGEVHALTGPTYYYSADCRAKRGTSEEAWLLGPKLVLSATMLATGWDTLRLRHHNDASVPLASWHFGFFMSAEEMLTKLCSNVDSANRATCNLPNAIEIIVAAARECKDLFGRASLPLERVTPRESDIPLPAYIMQRPEAFTGGLVAR